MIGDLPPLVRQAFPNLAPELTALAVDVTALAATNDTAAPRWTRR